MGESIREKTWHPDRHILHICYTHVRSFTSYHFFWPHGQKGRSAMAESTTTTLAHFETTRLRVRIVFKQHSDDKTPYAVLTIGSKEYNENEVVLFIRPDQLRKLHGEIDSALMEYDQPGDPEDPDCLNCGDSGKIKDADGSTIPCEYCDAYHFSQLEATDSYGCTIYDIDGNPIPQTDVKPLK